MPIQKHVVARAPARPAPKPAPAPAKAAPKPSAPARPAPPARPTPPHAAAIDATSAELAAALAAPVAIRRGPGRPSNAEIQARAANANGSAAPATVVGVRPVAPGGLTASQAEELRAKIVEQSELIAAQNEQLSKMRNKELQNVRTLAEITEGAENGIDLATDWRTQYHGQIVNLHDPIWENVKGGEPTIAGPNTALVMPCLLSFPRMLDPGNNGSNMRARKNIAAWHILREDGTYEGPPMYLTEAEFALVYAYAHN